MCKVSFVSEGRGRPKRWPCGAAFFIEFSVHSKNVRGPAAFLSCRFGRFHRTALTATTPARRDRRLHRRRARAISPRPDHIRPAPGVEQREQRHRKSSGVRLAPPARPNSVFGCRLLVAEIGPSGDSNGIPRRQASSYPTRPSGTTAARTLGRPRGEEEEKRIRFIGIDVAAERALQSSFDPWFARPASCKSSSRSIRCRASSLSPPLR